MPGDPAHPESYRPDAYSHNGGSIVIGDGSYSGGYTYASSGTANAIAIGGQGWTATIQSTPPPKPKGPLEWLDDQVEGLCAAGR